MTTCDGCGHEEDRHEWESYRGVKSRACMVPYCSCSAFVSTLSCEAAAPADEYCAVSSRCQLQKGHDGPHRAELGNHSTRMWDVVTFPINYAKEKPHA